MTIKKTEIEAVTKVFDDNIHKQYDMFTVTFIRSANEIISIFNPSKNLIKGYKPSPKK